MDNALLGLLLYVLPLGLDTFAIAAAVGATQLPGLARWRISAIFVIFEGGTPLVGLALGASVGNRVGGFADYFAGVLLIALGAYLYRSELDRDDDEDDEAAKARRLTSARGLALIGLALSISLDELAIGFGLGLGTDLTTPGAVIAVIGIQTLLVSQLGLAIGARISDHFREYIERCAGPTLVILGTYMLADAATQSGLVTARDFIVASIVTLIFAVVSLYRRYLTRARPTFSAPQPIPRQQAFTAAGPLLNSGPIPARPGQGRHRAALPARRALRA